jgi:transcriptional regulator with PAS, ATPase and Fis domain
VIKTKKPMLQAPRQEMEETYFVNMYPLIENDEVIGGLSVVTFIRQAEGFQKLLEQIGQRNNQIVKRISKASNAQYTFDHIVAASQSSLKVKEIAHRAARTDATVFLQAESGTGKEMYAQAIHNASSRNGNIFLSVNCANFNSNILESELFGYAEGAFTGAKAGGKMGLFEAASKGTLFLDEISEMDLSLQAKLLRFLQDQRIRPVGGVEERQVDVRIIAACNADLKNRTENGLFRSDLYYRLNVFPIHILPLRERKEDIEPLIAVILEELSRKFKRNISIEPDAIRQLVAYPWPGNVRELRNVIEFVSYLTDSGVISEDILPDSVKQIPGEESLTLRQRIRRFEKNEILKLLRINGGHVPGKQKTARQLGISLASLYNKLNV